MPVLIVCDTPRPKEVREGKKLYWKVKGNDEWEKEVERSNVFFYLDMYIDGTKEEDKNRPNTINKVVNLLEKNHKVKGIVQDACVKDGLLAKNTFIFFLKE